MCTVVTGPKSICYRLIYSWDERTSDLKCLRRVHNGGLTSEQSSEVCIYQVESYKKISYILVFESLRTVYKELNKLIVSINQ